MNMHSHHNLLRHHTHRLFHEWHCVRIHYVNKLPRPLREPHLDAIHRQPDKQKHRTEHLPELTMLHDYYHLLVLRELTLLQLHQRLIYPKHFGFLQPNVQTDVLHIQARTV
ncbi:hypothetical protein D3C79_958570 [compost metagenome]